MTGYHYTSWENWQKIKKQGLIPYKIKHDFSEFFDHQVYGIWLWKKRLQKASHLGSILDRLTKLKSFKIVLLKTNYDKTDTLVTENGDYFELTHEGSVEDWVYHNEKSTIITVRIPPENIELLGVYDFTKFF